MLSTIQEALKALQQNKPIIVMNHEETDSGVMLFLAEATSPETIQFMAEHAKGLMKVALTKEKIAELGLDYYGVQVIESIDLKTNEKGGSASARAHTIQALTKKEVTKDAFRHPGHVFPVEAKENGVLDQVDYTEAAIDMAKLTNAYPAGVFCEILNESGMLAGKEELEALADRLDLNIISLQEIIKYRKANEQHIKREIEAQLPSEHGEFKIVGYSNDLDDKEHIAIVKGNVNTDKPVMVRIHSECFTGDIFGSHRCDCGPQLHAALDMIEEEGQGVIVYMRQEGRGIGLLNKLRAYKLQEEGRDTHEANLELGFQADAREYHLAAQILEDLGVKHIRLLTNNPDKVSSIEECGIIVDSRLPLQPDYREENAAYMKTKKDKFGHFLDLHF